MERQLRDIHETGEALAALGASESIIYGRFGYGMASLRERWTIERHHTAFAHSPELGGRVVLVEPERAKEILPVIYERVCSQRLGMVKRGSSVEWDRRTLLWDLFGGETSGYSRYMHAVYERDGRPDGYVIYRTNFGEQRLRVYELMAATDEAHAALWQFCFGVDLYFRQKKLGVNAMPQPERWLPLFPLNTVLFPSASMPLQIFEERYKLLLQHCLDRDSKFGVVLIKSGSEVGEPAIPHTTGTMAHIVQVNKADGDRFFVSVTGLQRFQIRNITQYRPFLGAEVELLEDESDHAVPTDMQDAVRDAAARYVRLNLGLGGGWTRDVRLPSDPVRLANSIAGLLQVSLEDKQALLEEPSTVTRLETELSMLEGEVATLERRVYRELGGKFGRQ